MTDRIYYTDPSCRAFDATVTRVIDRDGRPAIVLDRTAFYPTSGGQPFDTGRLASASVVDVEDMDDHVLHIVSEPLPDGARVRGEIDWDRRFDHMQQHTGQHVLSAAFDRGLGVQTVGFHLGATAATIDLSREVTAEELQRSLEDANRVVWEDRPVAIRFASPDEAARLSLRKDPGRVGLLRLIEIADFDLSACGGTHVPRTGAIGMIAIQGVERVRGGSRVTFVCGSRALTAFGDYRQAVADSVRLLSVLPHELAGAIERSQLENKRLRKAVKDLQASLAEHEARRLVTETPAVDGRRLIACALEGWDQAGLKAVASRLVAHPGVAAALFTSTSPVAVVIARSKDVRVDASIVLRTLLERFGGRGGGKPDLAQGAGLDGDARSCVSAAREGLAATS